MINLKNISFDQCIKCTICSIYCPVSRATHLFPGPKQSGPDSERLRIKDPALIDSSIKYCTNCKRCETVCPSNVKIADLIQTAKYNYLKKKIRVRDFILSRLDILIRILSPISPIANTLMRNSLVKLLLEKFLGISRRQNFPAFERSSFKNCFKRNMQEQDIYDESVIFFPGCNVNYMDKRLGKDLVKILNAMNIGVTIPDNRCCGVPAIANSNIGRAKKYARYNIRSLKKALGDRDRRIVLSCSSGTLALKHEYANFLNLDTSTLHEKIDYITPYLFNRFSEGRMPALNPVHARVAYHSPCHLERIGGVMYTIDILKRVPGLDLVILNSECCGMSGTYGFKKEYFKISEMIGSQLFKKIDDAGPEVVVTDCVTCKWQIENMTGYRVLHPINILAMSVFKYGLDEYL